MKVKTFYLMCKNKLGVGGVGGGGREKVGGRIGGGGEGEAWRIPLFLQPSMGIAKK